MAQSQLVLIRLLQKSKKAMPPGYNILALVEMSLTRVVSTSSTRDSQVSKSFLSLMQDPCLARDISDLESHQSCENRPGRLPA